MYVYVVPIRKFFFIVKFQYLCVILTLDLDDAGLSRRILLIKFSETPPSCWQNSHAAILWVKFPETPSFYRQSFHGSASKLLNIIHDITTIMVVTDATFTPHGTKLTSTDLKPSLRQLLRRLWRRAPGLAASLTPVSYTHLTLPTILRV